MGLDTTLFRIGRSDEATCLYSWPPNPFHRVFNATLFPRHSKLVYIGDLYLGLPVVGTFWQANVFLYYILDDCTVQLWKVLTPHKNKNFTYPGQPCFIECTAHARRLLVATRDMVFDIEPVSETVHFRHKFIFRSDVKMAVTGNKLVMVHKSSSDMLRPSLGGPQISVVSLADDSLLYSCSLQLGMYGHYEEFCACAAVAPGEICVLVRPVCYSGVLIASVCLARISIGETGCKVVSETTLPSAPTHYPHCELAMCCGAALINVNDFRFYELAAGKGLKELRSHEYRSLTTVTESVLMFAPLPDGRILTSKNSAFSVYRRAYAFRAAWMTAVMTSACSRT